ncbi:MAG: saccharopine dehydrogenase NADP-binding domain-containing protein [Candidatus Eisenbacteria sp.]|nr:saccharopine dehydrogenase NADP-binding domain-containing protein [Candidatus Eisenbacteria bacterium]
MRVVLAGAGRMAAGVLHDLLEFGPPDEVLVLDASAKALERLRDRFPGAPVRLEVCDLQDLAKLAPLVDGYDGLISVASYRLNQVLTGLAIERGLHMIDLGGNPGVVRGQLELDAAARKAGVTVVPDCGLAPGMVSLLAADGITRVGHARRVQIRVGGLPLSPKAPLNYALFFSAEGLLNEYLEDCLVLRNGRPAWVPPLSELETLTFPEPYGDLEAFQTSGGTSTLPLTYEGVVSKLDYKTIRYPGHCRILRTLFGLGLADTEPVRTRLGEAVPREVLAQLLERHLEHDPEDVVLVRVVTESISSDGPASSADGPGVAAETGDLSACARVTHQLIAHSDAQAGLSAMQRATAFPASIVMQMILRGAARSCGVVPQEKAIAPGPFLAELARRGLEVEIRTT